MSHAMRKQSSGFPTSSTQMGLEISALGSRGIYVSGLLQDNMDKKCFLGVNFSTSTKHFLYNTML